MKILDQSLLEKEVIKEKGSIRYTLPFEFAPHFKDVFSSLDRDLRTYGVRSYSMRVATLEEVFIELGKKEHSFDAQEG